jgi:uncharacterized integral membrane protein
MVGMSSSSEPLVPPHQNIEPLPPINPDPESLPVAPVDVKHEKIKAPLPPDEAKKFTRAGALWTALAGGFLVLVLMLVFILQNTDSTTVHMFGWAWQLPVGVALLLGAIAGGFLTFLVGTVRILQLRRAAKKNYKAALR